jgi:hypothetical protein
MYLLTKSKLNRNKLMTKTTKTITFSTYHANICTDMGYMFMMTKNQSVKQININKNVFTHNNVHVNNHFRIAFYQTKFTFLLSRYLPFNP